MHSDTLNNAVTMTIK